MSALQCQRRKGRFEWVVWEEPCPCRKLEHRCSSRYEGGTSIPRYGSNGVEVPRWSSHGITSWSCSCSGEKVASLTFLGLASRCSHRVDSRLLQPCTPKNGKPHLACPPGAQKFQHHPCIRTGHLLLTIPFSFKLPSLHPRSNPSTPTPIQLHPKILSAHLTSTECAAPCLDLDYQATGS